MRTRVATCPEGPRTSPRTLRLHHEGGPQAVAASGRLCPWGLLASRVLLAWCALGLARAPSVSRAPVVSVSLPPAPSSVGTFARALDCSSSVRQPSLHMSAAAASRDITLVSGLRAGATVSGLLRPCPTRGRCSPPHPHPCLRSSLARQGLASRWLHAAGLACPTPSQRARQAAHRRLSCSSETPPQRPPDSPGLPGRRLGLSWSLPGWMGGQPRVGPPWVLEAAGTQPRVTPACPATVPRHGHAAQERV